jgi:hypothetical protein
MSTEAAPPASAPAAPSAEGASPPAADGAPAPAQTIEEAIYDLENLGDHAGKKWRLKRGETTRVVDSAELLRLGQLGFASGESFREISAKRKEVEAAEAKIRARDANIMRALDEDPVDALERMGYGDKLWEALERRAQIGAMTPEQRKAHELDERDRQVGAKEKAWQERQEAAKRAAEEQQLQHQQRVWQERLGNEYAAAMDKLGFPKSPALRQRSVRLMSQLHEAALDANVNVTAEDLARQVFRDEIEAGAREFVGAIEDPAALEALIGPERMRKVRQHDIAKLQSTRTEGGQFKPQKPAQPAEGRKRVRVTNVAQYRHALGLKK